MVKIELFQSTERYENHLYLCAIIIMLYINVLIFAKLFYTTNVFIDLLRFLVGSLLIGNLMPT